MFKNFTVWEAMRIGGPVMYVLIICSILSIAVTIERLFYFYQRSRIERAALMEMIKQALLGGDMKKALKICADIRSANSSVLMVGLHASNLDEKEITEAIDRQIIIETNDLQRRTAIVGTIGSTAVYIGLLGTVFGIIETFRDISQIGSGGIDVVIRGISAALVCTAAGLFVAIPAIIAYNYFVQRINGFVIDMELCASEVVSLMKVSKKIK